MTLIGGCVAITPAACGSSHEGGDAATKPTTTTPAAAVPRPIAGTWHARFGNVDQKIAFSATGYRVWVEPDDVARGKIRANGTRVVLYGSNTCAGSGAYRWSVAHSALTFREVGRDPCPRSQLLPKVAWKRLG
jgi:hypothetical protein